MKIVTETETETGGSSVMEAFVGCVVSEIYSLVGDFKAQKALKMGFML